MDPQKGYIESNDAETHLHEQSNRIKTIIIGVGVLGLATLRYIDSERPDDEVIAFDSCEKGSAIRDTHKIVRAQYTSRRRTETATEAQEAWKADPVLNRFYHDIGRIEITDDVAKLDAIDAISKHRERLTERSIYEFLKARNYSSRESCSMSLAARFLKIAKDPTLHCIWNPDNAVVNWDPCIREIRRSLESKIRLAKVEKLIVGDGGRICGLQLMDGQTVTVNLGDKIIMTPGAWGEALLKNSNIAVPPKHCQAVGVFTFHLKPSQPQMELLRNMPAVSFQTKTMNCEFLPPLSETGVVKIGLTLPFTNEHNEPQDVEESPLMYSAMLAVKRWVHQFFEEELGGAEIVAKQVHWDGVTEDQTLLISLHPEHGNLGVAWGGSYTHGKDLPNIGRTIDRILLQGKPSEEFSWHSVSSADVFQHNQPLLRTNNLFTDMNAAAARDGEGQMFMQQWDLKHI